MYIQSIGTYTTILAFEITSSGLCSVLSARYLDREALKYIPHNELILTSRNQDVHRFEQDICEAGDIQWPPTHSMIIPFRTFKCMYSPYFHCSLLPVNIHNKSNQTPNLQPHINISSKPSTYRGMSAPPDQHAHEVMPHQRDLKNTPMARVPSHDLARYYHTPTPMKQHHNLQEYFHTPNPDIPPPKLYSSAQPERRQRLQALYQHLQFTRHYQTGGLPDIRTSLPGPLEDGQWPDPPRKRSGKGGHQPRGKDKRAGQWTR